MNKEDFMKEIKRLDTIQMKMCSRTNCNVCVLREYCCYDSMHVKLYNALWDYAEEHKPKTRQSEFLKLFPDSRLDECGTINICPNNMENLTKCPYHNCEKCKKEYWLKEIEDGDKNV